MNFSSELDMMLLEFAKRSRLEVALATGVWGILSLLALLGNLLTLLIVCRNRTLWTPTNIFIASLAFSDLGFPGFNGIPLGIPTLASKEWPFNRATCQFQGFTALTLGTASTMTLAGTAVNRYYRVVRPARYKRIFSTSRTLVAITVTWVLALLASVPYLASGQEFVFQPAKGFCVFALEGGVFTAIFVTTYIGIPSVVICYSYFRVFIVVRRHTEEMAMSNTINAATLKTTKTLFVIVFVFMCCWTPILAIDLVDTFAGRWIMPRGIYMAYSLLALTSSLVNPVIYVIMNPTFRKEYVDILTCRTLRLSRVTAETTGSSSQN